MIAAIVFDFDGVILESVDVKTRAFAALFETFTGHKESIVAYHLENLGISRYRKFEHIYGNILHMPFSEATKNELDRRFRELIFNEIRNCPFVPGVVRF